MIDTKEILRDTYVKVDLGRIAKNMTLIREMAGPDVAVMPVIKANGYGHGAVNIAPVLVESGASYLAVATLTEAMELREAYPDYPLFILGHTPDRLLHYAAEQNITQTVFSLRQARILANAARKAGRKAKVHIKVDTGMGRIGITPDEEGLEFVRFLMGHPELEVEGIFTHFAKSDEEDKTSASAGTFSEFYRQNTDRAGAYYSRQALLQQCGNLGNAPGEYGYGPCWYHYLRSVSFRRSEQGYCTLTGSHVSLQSYCIL